MTPSTTLTLTVVTSLFSGDDANGADPIRVPSIRGALRFWFRPVTAGHGVTDLKTLWHQEEEVFGSTNKPSPIALRLREQPRTSKNSDWANPDIGYLLRRALDPIPGRRIPGNYDDRES